MRLIAPGPGRATARAKARSRIRVGRASRTVERAGAVTLKVRPSRAAKRALKRRKRLKVTLRVTFRPEGGETVSAPVRRVALRRR